MILLLTEEKGESLIILKMDLNDLRTETVTNIVGPYELFVRKIIKKATVDGCVDGRRLQTTSPAYSTSS